LDAAVEIAVDEAILSTRMAHRAKVEGRPDDRPDAFQRRLEDYRAQAQGLRAHYDGRLIAVDGDETPDEVYARLVQSLRQANVLHSQGT
jgi:adenylate kinase